MFKRLKSFVFPEIQECKDALAAANARNDMLYDIYQTTVNNKPVNSIKLLKFTKKVLAQHGECYVCGSKEQLNAHHIYPKGLHPSLAYTVDNGICLCRECHNSYHHKYKDLIAVGPTSLANFKRECQNDYTYKGK